MSNVPADLIHCVLVLFHTPEDTQTLRYSALVCRYWLPIARKYLFSTLRTKEEQSANYASRGLASFEPLLAHSPGIGYAVRTLFVEGARPGCEISLSNLRRVLCHLPRLQHLSLSRVKISSTSESILGAGTYALRSLELRDIGVYVDGPCHIFRLFRLFHSIRELSIENVWFNTANITGMKALMDVFPIPNCLRLTSLTIHGADENSKLLLEAFRHIHVPEALRSLHLSFRDITPLLPSFISFLSDPRCRLDSFALDFSRCFPYAFWADRSGLIASQNAVEELFKAVEPALRRLKCFTLYPGCIPREATAFWEMALAVLRMLPSEVAEVHLHLAKGQFGLEVPRFIEVIQMYACLEMICVRGLREDSDSDGIERALKTLNITKGSSVRFSLS